jgi:hypothetical protein
MESTQEWAKRIRQQSEQESEQDKAEQETWLDGLPELPEPPTKAGEVQAILIPKVS